MPTIEQDAEAYAEHQRAGGARPKTIVARLSGVRSSGRSAPAVTRVP
jgi:hypothetical protein